MNRRLRFSIPAFLCALGLFAQTVDVRILQTADLHAAVEHTRDDAETGGWLRIATEVDRLRAAAGPERTLVIDCGDTCQGTLLGVATRGAIGPAMLEAVGYDVWVTGNHEFDFGLERFVELSDAYARRLLCGNVRVVQGDKTHSWPSWRLFEKDGARIAVIGANASYLRHWFPEHGARLEVDLAADQLRRDMPAILRARPHAIVLAIHQGWMENDPREVNEIPTLVRLFPELDLVLGAHTHRPWPGRRLGVKTWYVQPPPHAAAFVQVDLKIDLKERRVADVQSRLVAPGADVPPSERVARAVAPMLEQGRKMASRQVGRVAAAVSAEGTPGIDCGTSELLCRVLAEATDSSVVVHGRLSPTGLSAGDVIETHLFELVPYENDIYTACLTPAELAEVVAEQWRNRKSYVFCGLYGVSASIDGDHVRLGSLPPGSLGRDGRVQVAFNSYTAAGGGGRFPVLSEILERPESRKRNTGIATRDALRAFLNRHPALGIQPREWLRKGE